MGPQENIKQHDDLEEGLFGWVGVQERGLAG